MNIWTWIFYSLVFWLILELGPFFIVSLVFKKTATELAGPYLAFAMPWAIMAPLIWWLRKWEDLGASPQHLARGWGLSMALFGIINGFAVFYTGFKFNLINLSDAVISFIITALFSSLIYYIGMYHRVLKSISARDVKRSRT